MNQYEVTVTVDLVENCCPEDAEMEYDDVGDHLYRVQACCSSAATEKALDRFHSEVPIGCLDYVEISTAVVRI